MSEALTSYFEEGSDREISEEVAYHLAEINEVAHRYSEAFKRLSEARQSSTDAAEALRLLSELQALIFEQGIVHAKDLRRPLEELQGMLDDDVDSCPGGGD